MSDFKNLITDETSTFVTTEFTSALSDRYLAYALSTITSRSLPDVRDGLKPVHRRLLFAMQQLKLDPEKSFKKSARVVGDVIGKYHPHGDSAIYDAMVRLAQEFAMRYPLVDGQGNFGNIDGDNAAAMRYTEARLTKVSRLLLNGIDENAVDFRQTYDGESEEPILLPAAFPNLLANGAQGIAVGMATSIPPHNIIELVEAAKHLVKHPGSSIETLMNFVKGPDFPTGGVLVEPENSILSAYKTGKGSFRLRASYEVEKEKNGLWRIIVTQIPFQIQKSRLIEKLADALQQKKLPMLQDIRDESAEDIRILLEPKSRRLSPEAVMESLFHVTDLEIRIPLNLNVLDQDNKPNVIGLKEALQLGTVNVRFRKKDGTERKMSCTLQDGVVPKATKEDVIKTAWVEGMIVKDTHGYEMPPHQDGGSFIVGYAQLFLADKTDDYHGIVLHKSLDPTRKMDMVKATNGDTQGDEYDKFYKDHNTEAVVSYPYKKNCLYALGCDETTWHEVKKVEQGFERYSAIWQLYWNERGQFV